MIFCGAKNILLSMHLDILIWMNSYTEMPVSYLGIA